MREVVALSISVAFLVFFLVVITVTDICYGVIPNKIVLWALINGIFVCIMCGRTETMLGGAFLALMCSMPLYIIRAVGAGDVKAYTVMGMVVADKVILKIGLYALVCMVVYGLVIKLYRGKSGNTRVAMAPALLMGYVIEVLMGGIV